MMTTTKLNVGIIGAGGFANEVAAQLGCISRFYVTAEYAKRDSILSIDEANWSETHFLIAISDSYARQRIVKQLHGKARFFKFIHQTALNYSNLNHIGDGLIACALTVVTTNVMIGVHAHLNLHVTVGHDCKIGDYFTAAPGARVSGNCVIGNHVYLGTNASVRQGLHICDNVTIGMNSAVVRDIPEPGVYAGTPARKIKESV